MGPVLGLIMHIENRSISRYVECNDSNHSVSGDLKITTFKKK